LFDDELIKSAKNEKRPALVPSGKTNIVVERVSTPETIPIKVIFVCRTSLVIFPGTVLLGSKDKMK